MNPPPPVAQETLPVAVPEADARDAAAAILLMCAAVGSFSVGDGIAKVLLARYPLSEVVWARYTAQLLLVLPVALAASRVRDVLPRRYGLQLLRTLFIFSGGIIFYYALQYIPLAEASAIGLVSPLVVTALSVPILGEKVGIRRWLAVGAGFAGVLIIIRPGFATGHWAMVLPLIMAVAFALTQILTRMMISTETQMSTLVFPPVVVVVALGPAVAVEWVTPTAADVALMLVMGTLGGLSHLLLFRAYRKAQPSVLAPFIYTQLVWMTVFGYVVFGDFPDAFTMLGGTVIVGSGLYVFYRESSVRRRARQASAEGRE